MSIPADISTTVEAPDIADVDAPDGSGVSDEQWARDSWGDDDKHAKEEAELEAWLSEEDDDGEEADEDDDEEVERKPRRAQSTKEDAEDAPAKGKPAAKQKPEVKAEPEKPSTYKVKLGKEERELDAAKMARALGTTEEALATVDPNTATRLYQKLWHAEQRQSEGAQAIQQFEAFLGQIKGDPIQALTRLLGDPRIGLNLKELATQHLAQEFELSALPESERELRRAKAELERVRSEQQRVRQAEEQRQQQEQRAEYARRLNGEIMQALTDAKLPSSTRMRGRLVALMQRERQERDDSMSAYSSPKELITALRAEMREDFAAFTEGMTAAELSKFIGEAHVKALGEHRVKGFRERQQAQLKRGPNDAPVERTKKVNRRKTWAEVLREM